KGPAAPPGPRSRLPGSPSPPPRSRLPGRTPPRTAIPKSPCNPIQKAHRAVRLFSEERSVSMIRPATAADLPRISTLYDAILTRAETGGPVYTNRQRGKYPTEDTARQALEAGTLYVGETDGILWGVVNLNGT